MFIIKPLRNALSSLGRVNQARHLIPDDREAQSRLELDVLIQIAEILTQPTDFPQKCDLMLQVLSHVADADIAVLRPMDPDGLNLRLIASYDPGDHSAMASTLPLSYADCPMSRAVIDQEVLEIADSSKLDRPLPNYYFLARSLLYCPVMAGNDLLGILGFSSASKNKFGRKTVELMTAITSTIGVLMENARLQEERLLGDRKLVRLAQALESTEDAIVLADNQGNIEYVNKSARELGSGLFLDPSTSSSSPAESHEQGDASQSAGTQTVLPAGTWSREVRRLTLNGEAIDISLSINDVVDGQNKKVGQITTGRDVTENLHMQEDLIRLNREREIEANIARIVSSPLEISAVFDRFSHELSNVIPFDLMSITGVDLEKKIFIASFLFQEGEKSYDLGSGEPFHGTVAGAAVETGRCVSFNVNDGSLPAGIRERLASLIDQGATSFMATPLVSQDKVVGALAVAREGDPYTPEDRERVTRIGNLIAGALSGHLLQQAMDEAEAEAAENEARFLQVAENLRGGFWLSEVRPRKVLYNSPSNAEVWGIPAEKLNQGWQAIRETIHPEDVERVEASLELAYQTGELDEEFRIFLPDGSIRWLSDRGYPIRDASGEIYRIAGFVEDITERKEADFRLAESERLASIGELSAGVAHEINNPLTSIVLYSQMLLDEDIPDAIRADLQVVSSQAYRAAKIVRNLLQFARKSDPEKRPLSIGWLVRRSLEMKSHEFNINNISVVEDIPDGLPLIMMDEHLILQVLLNVLTNAEQACVSAHGRGNITVSASVADNKVDIAIQDDGPGIPTEDMSKIFQPFFTTKETGFGTGLGLSVSHGILVQHEGNIWAESELRSGTTVHVELPLSADIDLTLLNTSPKPESTTTPVRSTSHVLVVDDEPDLRAVLIKQFELRRYNVDQAGDGEEAWRKLQSLDYDCIMLDLRMPGMGGQELYGKILSNHPDLISSIIFITGDTVNPATKLFLSGVSNPVLSKPFDFRELEQLVVSVINRGTGGSQSDSGHVEPGLTSSSY